MRAAAERHSCSSLGDGEAARREAKAASHQERGGGGTPAPAQLAKPVNKCAISQGVDFGSEESVKVATAAATRLGGHARDRAAEKHSTAMSSGAMIDKRDATADQ